MMAFYLHQTSRTVLDCVVSVRSLPTSFLNHLPPRSLCMANSLHSGQVASPDVNPSSSLEIGDYKVEGISIGGHETCVIIPKLKVAFDIGRCPQRAIAQDFLFISHGHMDHIGGVAMYVATRGLYKMKPPTIIVPKCIKETVEKLFEVYRQLDGSELKHELIALDVDRRNV